MPEWMDYTPETERPEEEQTKKEEEENKQKEVEARLMHDLEAWKSSMKKKETEQPAFIQQTTAIEKPLASLSLEPSQDPLLFFDESAELRREQKGGSRFANGS